MAAAFTTTASALSTPNALSSRGAAGLSSGNAFQTTSIVQQGPVTSRAHRMVAARASLGAKESNVSARREVLASLLAAGAALGFGGRAVADPIEDAKVQAGELFKTTTIEKGKEIIDEKAPKVPDAGPAVEEAKKKVAGSIDNIFGKGKSPPFKLSPTSGPGSTKYQQSFDNLAFGSVEGAKSAASGAASDAKSSAESAKSTVQSKGDDLVGSAKEAAPSAPSTSSLPDLPKIELPKVDLPKVELPKFGQ